LSSGTHSLQLTENPELDKYCDSYLLKGLNQNISQCSKKRGIISLVDNLTTTIKASQYKSHIDRKHLYTENELVRQYLRKFTFFYHNEIKNYGTDLLNISRKKTNSLAIEALFCIRSL
jgi:hypothetical protein